MEDIKRPRGGQLQRKIRIEWSPNLAYAIGLITADGNLSKDQRHISFISKDIELINHFREALSLQNKTMVNRSKNGRIWYVLTFGDKIFYRFLNDIGIKSAKSKTIQSVQIPKDFFADFLRGFFDGDGTFYTFWDKRWPNSFCFKLSFASASKEFLDWLMKELSEHYGTAGCIHKGKGVDNLEYAKGDSRKLIEIMYADPLGLRLQRKFDRMQTALEEDKTHGKIFLQKRRENAELAQR